MGTQQPRAAVVIAVVACLAGTAFAAGKQQLRYSVTPGANITVVNEFGPVTVKPSDGNQVIVTATPASNKVEVDGSQNGNRVDVRTHFLQHTGDQEGRVDYEVLVPQDATVSIRAGGGPVHIEKLHGDVTVEGDGAPVDVRDLSNAMVHVRTVSGPVTLTNVNNGHIELSSISGNLNLTNVTGPQVRVSSTRSAIVYTGNFGGGGAYSLTSHSGPIDVTLPADASVDVTARSVSGKVQNEYPFQPKTHVSFPADGRSFAGTANSGASLVRLRSFSGTISVKKQ